MGDKSAQALHCDMIDEQMSCARLASRKDTTGRRQDAHSHSWKVGEVANGRCEGRMNVAMDQRMQRNNP